MNIRQKMLLGAAALTLIPVAFTSLLIWQGASNLAEEAIREQERTQLVSLRDTKRQQITDELNERVTSLQVLAAQRSTIEAYKQMKSSFYSAGKELSKTVETGEATKNLNDYIGLYFNNEYVKRNPNAAPSLAKAVATLDANAIAMQTVFVVDNPNPVGLKEQMDVPPVDFAYGRAHAQYHPSFEKAQKLSGYYDIFMIDSDTDTVIYSVFKELDFATKLTGDGIASKTKLAEAYLKAKEVKVGTSYMSDFAPYLASYDDQAAFVAVPIYDGIKQIGVLAMQYPIDKLTETMNANKAWKSIGLGDTGDIFLVGPDKLMRTNARYLIEDKASFTTQMGDKLDARAKGLLDKKNTTIGLIKIDSDATRPALEGKDGVLDFVDYRGIASIGAYAPVKVQGLNWGIVAKINEAEANQPIDALDRSSLLRALLIAVAVVVVAALGVTLFLRQFLSPITKLSDTVKAVAGGETTARSQLVEKDEIGDLGRAFDNLLDERNAALSKATEENENINNSAIGLLQGVFQLSNKDLTARAPVTEDIVGTISASVNQLADEIGSTLADVRGVADEVRRTSASLQEQSRFVENAALRERESLDSMSETLGRATQQLNDVAQLSGTSSATALRTASATQAAQTAVEGTVRGMDALRESISETEKRFKRLGERSQEISSAVALVNTISERTHVLSLNASMQAATAGEAGRGFAVVAQEVQRLSDSSRQATAQISQLVANIQAETNETLLTMNRLISDVVSQTELARQAGHEMTQTQTATTELVALVQQIAAFSTQQEALAAALQQNVLDINDSTNLTSSAIAQQSQATQTLVMYAGRLTDAVGQFTLPDANANKS
ncbi:MAG: methyl-accepting chemotaxis protein [Polaromonas sp.]